MLKKFALSPTVIEFLGFFPITSMAALWFQQIFIQHLGELPGINYLNLCASLPTIISVIVSKNLLVIVTIRIISAALFNLIL
ncbi:AzlD domain-containing protein [Ligilactobacillus acidipiscis]|uniref:AzlD domain-containing protein n=1 Tax=Ligilactobacillus acidipiscis TaxID=89059 RepID=UPI0012AB8D6A